MAEKTKAEPSSRSGLGKGVDNFVDWIHRNDQKKYGRFFQGTGNTQNTPSPSSAGGSRVEPKMNLDAGTPNKIYWSAQSIGRKSLGATITNSLNRMDRSEIPDATNGVDTVLGKQPSNSGQNYGGVASQKNAPKLTGVNIGGNEGILPKLSFGSPPPVFYNSPPAWVTDNEKYTNILNTFGMVVQNKAKENEPRTQQAVNEVLAGSGFLQQNPSSVKPTDTYAALLKFQKSAGIEQTGSLDEDTVAALKKTAGEIRQWGTNR
jgi:hypothetical protein